VNVVVNDDDIVAVLISC